MPDVGFPSPSSRALVVDDVWLAVLGRDPALGQPYDLLHVHDAVDEPVCGEVTWVWDGEAFGPGPDVDPT